MIENWAKGKSFRLQLLDRYTSGFRAVSGLFFCLFPPSYNVILIKFYHATIGNV